jgi:hypothetical protein
MTLIEWALITAAAGFLAAAMYAWGKLEQIEQHRRDRERLEWRRRLLTEKDIVERSAPSQPHSAKR